MLNFKIIGNLVGLLIILVGILMLTALPFSIMDDNRELFSLGVSAAISIITGTFLINIPLTEKDKKSLTKREGYLIVTLGWVFMSFFGSLPYIISGAIPGITDAVFETVSGLTTTGASVLNDIESLPKGILFWRSMTQWIGGMGIIVMTVAILPMLGIGGMELFVAEAPGPTSDKIHPRIKETAKRLYIIYFSLTALLTVLLLIGGMTFYDAINHALTTMATGGFSTKQDSVAFFNSAYIEYVITLFMFIAGINYTMMYFGLKGRFKQVIKNEEFRYYLYACLGLTLFITINIFMYRDYDLEEAFRHALFQVVSIITTTGFVSADYMQWTSPVIVVIFVMLFIGGSAGSTSGGIKIVRHLVMAKNCFLEFKRLIHPRAVIPVKLNGAIVSEGIITNVLVFLLVYMVIFVFSSIILSSFGLDFDTSISAVATTLGNVGPGIGTVGPTDNFFHIPSYGKWFLSFLMILGRLELFTVLILLTPYFWKNS